MTYNDTITEFENESKAVCGSISELESLQFIDACITGRSLGCLKLYKRTHCHHDIIQLTVVYRIDDIWSNVDGG